MMSKIMSTIFREKEILKINNSELLVNENNFEKFIPENTQEKYKSLISNKEFYSFRTSSTNKSIPSGTVGIFAPSLTTKTPLSTKFWAS